MCLLSLAPLPDLKASDLARRASRFVLVARRLEAQMVRVKEVKASSGDGEREVELAKAALSIAELGKLDLSGCSLSPDSLLKPSIAEDEDLSDTSISWPLQSLDFVSAFVPTVDKARDTVIQEMEGMVISGLADLVSLRSSSPIRGY